MGEFLQIPDNYICGDVKELGIYNAAHQQVCTNAANFTGNLSVYAVDYELMHHRFRHMSKQVLKKAKGSTKSFPQDLDVPSKIFAFFQAHSLSNCSPYCE